ncbi:MAG: hypothetical protein CBB97_13675 [Candidatus Endolissoclinum sp. TMED37]|nr:MAG: hypothetical protein CBB97_13675 [Candidatus Endolissoclinum sp. TMED37]
MSRLFSTSQKKRLFIRCDGKCEICGEYLNAGWHAHHVQPYSQGGMTELYNAQALCEECHKRVHSKEEDIHGSAI